jgi:4-nitrophenyl phosphatase
VNAFRLAIFDLDGTLYRGDEALPDAVEVLNELHRRGVVVRYVTNNSSKTVAQTAEKLLGMGFRVENGDVMTSALATARALTAEGHQTAWTVGEAGLNATLEAAGITITKESPDALVVGICRSFTYEVLDEAMQVGRGGAAFYATNRDATYPYEKGRFGPGAGTMVAALETALGRSPVTIGKPEPTMILDLIQGAGVLPSETLVVGDRLDTDIEAGLRAGTQVHLVLTGVATEAPAGVPSSPDLRALIQ